MNAPKSRLERFIVIPAAALLAFTLSPFAITHFDPLQLFGAFVLGLFFAFVFHRTGILLGPIIMHSYANGNLVVGRYSLVFLFS